MRDRRRETWREVRAIAGLEALDGFRSRRQLIVRAVTPIVLFGCVMGITLALRGSDTLTHPDPYTVAVQGDYEGAKQTLDAINGQHRLTFIPSDDAKVATISEVDAGLLVPDHLDDTLRDHFEQPAAVEVYEIAANPPSRAAALLLNSGFVEHRNQAVRNRIAQLGGSADGKGLFSPNVVNVERTSEGTRTVTSQVIPGLLCLQAGLLVAGTANRLVSRRTRGLLMAQLLLPVSRRSLATAKGLGELAIGTLTALPVALGILGFGFVIAASANDTNAMQILVSSTVPTIITMLVLFSLTTALGVLVGTAARTQEQVSLATGFAIIFATLVAATVALSSRAAPSLLSVVPFAGSVGALKDQLNGGGSTAALVVSTLSTLAGAFVFTTWAGRSLDAERMVLRNG